jgi:hypothetical protein
MLKHSMRIISAKDNVMKMNNYDNKNSKKNSKREKKEGYSKYEAMYKNVKYDEKEVKQEINNYK